MVDYELWFKQEFPTLKQNGLWSILPDTAYFLFHLVLEKKPKLILEFGSGVSTAVLARAASQYGGKVYALEHELKWLEKARKDCEACGLGNFEIIYAPLVDSGFNGVAGYQIYDPAKIPQEEFDFIFIDGPQGFLPEHPGRRGTLYAAWPFLAERATVVMDDAEREGEKLALREWRKVLKMLRVKYASRNLLFCSFQNFSDASRNLLFISAATLLLTVGYHGYEQK